MDHDFSKKSDQKVVLVTGSSRRVGEAIIREFHLAGFNVIIHFCNAKDAATELSQELSSKRPQSSQIWHRDLCETDDFAGLIDMINSTWGRLDVLVNNASTFAKTPIGQTSFEDWHTLFGSNVKGAYFLTQALVPLLQMSKGSIVNITDIHAQDPMRDYSVYCMAKSALHMMTLALAKELAPNVRVNAVAPGIVAPPEGDNALSLDLQKKLLAKIPLQRFGTPGDLAKVVYQLAVDSPYVTGHVIPVDGGRHV